MRLKLIIFAFALTLAPMVARADLGFSLTPAARSGVGSNEVWFTAALTNVGSANNLFLNSIQIEFMDAATNHLVRDTNIFFSNVPGILLPGEIYQDVAFGVRLTPTIPPGEYIGSVTLQGGTNIFENNTLANGEFQISLPPALLEITISTTNLLLAWPSPPAGFSLQANADLNTTNWITVTNSPTSADGQNQLTLLRAATNQFYRLKYP